MVVSEQPRRKCRACCRARDAIIEAAALGAHRRARLEASALIIARRDI